MNPAPPTSEAGFFRSGEQMFKQQYDYTKETAHLVCAFDGVVDRTFTCVRCKRRLPEQQFALMGEVRSARRTTFALHLHCHTCREQRKGEWVKHPDYSPALDRYWNKFMARLRGGAVQRGIIVSIDKDDLLGLWFEQDGHCAVTGLKLNWKAVGAAGRGNKAHFAPSVDRIDSRGNYVSDNIQITAQVVNLMKGDLPMASFVELCGVIADRNISL